jgi:hypothetical protein
VEGGAVEHPTAVKVELVVEQLIGAIDPVDVMLGVASVS